ncbi:MAG: hypothetical protein CFE40_05195 [Burkholderiales bacterium PBB1]|nr:MAG: hypothetical protein CFE40_05195 [Burkholderiales bacterium PBB1]
MKHAHNPNPAMISNTVNRWLAAAALSLLSLTAWADSPVTGATLYSANCTGSGCHNTTTPLTSNASKIYNARNARAWIQSNINSNNSGMGRLSGMTAQQVADVAAYLGNTPTTLTYPSTNVGSSSATQQVTVYASLKTGYSLSGLSVTTSGDFARAGGTCATTVGTGLSCTILVNFTPTASGTRTGTLNISHNNTLTPVVIALSGTGAGAAAPAPVASISPTSLTLASTAVGNTSASQSVTVSNTGTAALTLSALTLSNTADYIISGGTCAAGGSVAAGANCTISVAFKPATTGTRTGTLGITHNAAGSPGSVSLTGAATAAPAPVASQTASLAFGSQNVGSAGTPQTATLTNTGNAALVLGTMSISSGTEFSILSGGSCANGASIAAGASCTVSVGFTPSVAGARSANLVITHNATGGQSTTSLSGTGVALTPVIGVSPTTLTFSQTVNTTSADQTVTVSNTGTAPLAISALTLGGTQASDYRISSGGTCTAGGSVAVSGSCTVRLAFAPTAIGARNANLSIAHNATGSPSTVTLNGTGTAAPQPTISLNATTKTFTSQTVGTTSAAQTVTVTNSGSAPLGFTGFTLTGTAAGDFTRGGTCATSTPLAAASTCTVTIAFAPTATGTRSATLTIASNASNGNAAVTLSGTATAAPAPAAALAPASLAFGNQTQSTTSTARNVTLTNAGTAALTISSITASAPFAISGTTCGASLAAAASCTVSVTFSPTALGAASGSVSLTSNAAGSPHSVGLSGTGVVASPVLAWNPTTSTVSFGSLTVGDPATTQTVTLLNQGPGAVTLSGFTLAGGHAADYAVSGGTCAVNGSLTQGASCFLTLAFNPGAAGSRNATLQVTSTGTNPPTLTLTGTATAPAAPVATLSASTLNFSAIPGEAASPQPLSIQNTGNAVLTVTGMQIASGSFTLDPALSNGCSALPFDLLPGQSCAMSIGWSSSADGTEAGMVEITTNASSTPAQVSIQAVRAAAITPPAPSGGSSGGCSIARGESPLDPVLWLLTLGAAGVLWLRRARRR